MNAALWIAAVLVAANGLVVVLGWRAAKRLPARVPPARPRAGHRHLRALDEVGVEADKRWRA